MEMEMADNPFQTLSPSEDASEALAKSPPARPAPSPHPSYGTGKEPEPPVPGMSEHHPTTSQSYDDAGGGQGYLAHGMVNAEPDQSSPNPPFQPFFTIIEDAHMHYIFSDDDTDIIKEAGFRSLEIQGITIPAEKKEKEFEDDPDSPTDPDANEEDKSILPSATPGVRTHYLLLDVEPFSAPTEQVTPDAKNMSTSPAGPGAVTSPISPPAANPAAVPHTQYRVTSAKSFSPTWQILNADLVPAPTFDSQDANDGPSHGMMLNIRGTGGLPKDPRSKEDGLEALMGRFEKHMSELQAVIDSAKVEEVGEVEVENEQAVEHEGENESKAEVDAGAEIEAHGAELS
ncbi:unnamed protein product [Penicillium pancosmium]